MKSFNNHGLKEDRSQTFLYETPGFEVYSKKNVFPEQMPFCVTNHWHDELEFVYVKSGSIQYMVEGETMILNKGQGLFVNSRNLHVAMANNHAPSVFYITIFHPLLLCASRYIDEKYVEPIIRNNELKYILLEEKTDWGKEALHIIEQIQIELEENENGHLKIQVLSLQLWTLIYEHTITPQKSERKPNHHLSTLKKMISYIQNNYTEKITLEDISNAGSVGKTMCTTLFNTYVNKTPMEFLRDYRVQQSIVLLQTTDMAITEICYETGFSGASYYGECFKKVTGCSPLEYRHEHSDLPLSHYSRRR